MCSVIHEYCLKSLYSTLQIYLSDAKKKKITAPKIIEEIFEIVKTLNEEDGVSFLVSEQNANIALKYAKVGYIIENGRVVLKGSASELSESDSVKDMYMGGGGDEEVSFKNVKYYHRRRPCMV